MGHPLAHGRLSRALTATAAAALMLGAASAAAASDTSPPATAKAKRAYKKQQRFCIVRNVAGQASTEKLCKTRGRWISQNGYDPVTER